MRKSERDWRRTKVTGVTVHEFRSTFRGWGAERTNLPRAICEATLSHTIRDKGEAAYYRTDLFDRRRELMNAWAGLAVDTVAFRA